VKWEFFKMFYRTWIAAVLWAYISLLASAFLITEYLVELKLFLHSVTPLAGYQ